MHFYNGLKVMIIKHIIFFDLLLQKSSVVNPSDEFGWCMNKKQILKKILSLMELRTWMDSGLNLWLKKWD